MASTTFTNSVTLSDAGWFNDVDAVTYDGLTTQILVGGGAGSVAVWTAATGTGAPVRAGSPTLTGTAVFDAATFGGGYGASGCTIAATGNIQTNGSLTVDGTSTLTGSVGIGGASDTAYGLKLVSAALVGTAQYGISSVPVGTSGATVSLASFIGAGQTAAAAFTCPGVYVFRAADGTAGSGSTITSQYGFYCNDLAAATNNYAFSGAVTAGDNKYNLNMSGTAKNYLAGELLVGKTASNLATVGCELNNAGYAFLTRDGGAPLFINRLSDDGQLASFRQAGTEEGDITVSGTTVSLTGAHLARWSQWAENKAPQVLRGTVLSNLDQMCDWKGESNEQLNRLEVSSAVSDGNVAGVFDRYDTDDKKFVNDFYCAQSGDFVIRVRGTVQRGDLLISAGDGTAKPQGDDVIRSSTIAKVSSPHKTLVYKDGSYLVPCVLLCGG